MHILEIIMYLFVLGLFIVTVYFKALKKSVILFLWCISWMLIITHLVMVGTRWQLYFLYIAVFLIGIIIYFDIIMRIDLKKGLRRFLMFTSLILFMSSGITVFVFPVYNLPEPSGEYLIGTDSFVIEDESRLELYSDELEDFRKTKIQVWYPAETVSGYDKAPWIEDGTVVTRALSNDIGLPFFALDHTAKIMSNAYINAPLSQSQSAYPIVIISHGWRGFKNLHTDYAEELASLGYIVVSIDHAYGSVATVYDENDVAYLNPDALPDRNNTSDFITYANQLVYTYASDITVTLDYLEEINEVNSGSRFSGKLDINSIGLIGHSTGGGADVAVALDDERIKAVIGLDAWVEPINQDDVIDGLAIPSLFIRSETWETGENNDHLLTLVEYSTNSALYQIEGTTHYDFAMVYMYSPLTPYIGFSGSIDNQYLVTIVKDMIVDFFNDTLINNTVGEIDPSQWEEVSDVPIN